MGRVIVQKSLPINDFDEFHDSISGPYREVYHNREVMEELRFVFKHIDKK